MEKKKGKEEGLSRSTVISVTSVVFILLGYQIALFVHNAAVTKIAANRDEPDTVFVYRSDQASPPVVTRKNSSHSPVSRKVREALPPRKVESFRFDPNTVSVDELCRLGFSPKQAQSIENYRNKGGRFRRKEDFAKSFVVSDSIYRRLESYIDIPLVDLNRADSAALDALPGIGGWFASRIIGHRNALGGYSYKEQLMDIYRFDREKYEALADLVTVDSSAVKPYRLWTLPADSLRLHPYIGNLEAALAIVLYRENNPKEAYTIKGLAEAGVLSEVYCSKLSRCHIAPP